MNGHRANPSGFGTIAFQEFMEVRVVRQDGEPGDGGEVLWTVEMRDSLFNREMADPRTGQPVALADRVIVLRQVFREAGSSITPVPGNPPGPPDPFFHHVFPSDLGAYLLFRSRQARPNSTPVPGAGGGRTVLETFNGMPVDIGIPTPTEPLAKEAKISCSSIRRNGMGTPALKVGEARAFDLRGRRILGVAGR